jgi:hypothetical protein
MTGRKKIAAILTTCFTRSHAEVILPKLIKGFPTDDGILEPKVDLASIYLDQIHEADVCVPFAREHGIPIYPSIVKALTLGGGELAVDGVLIIGEHGDYGSNEKGQKLYPRRFFFEQVCGLFSTSGHSVPVFNDKHLSYSWEQARWMYDRARALKVPFMAGSSLPVAYRNPWLEYELETPVEEALSMAYGGLDAYGFHALELLQCMVERRRNGETGIVAVQCLRRARSMGGGKAGTVVAGAGRCRRGAHQAESTGTDGGQLRESRPVSPRICRRSARRESDPKRAPERLGLRR